MIERCEACFIYPGGRVCREMLDSYRGHSICDWCLTQWKKYEKRFHRTIGFDEYVRGIKTEPVVSHQAIARMKRDKQIRKQAQGGKNIKELMSTFGLAKRTIIRALGGK